MWLMPILSVNFLLGWEREFNALTCSWVSYCFSLSHLSFYVYNLSPFVNGFLINVREPESILFPCRQKYFKIYFFLGQYYLDLLCTLVNLRLDGSGYSPAHKNLLLST